MRSSTPGSSEPMNRLAPTSICFLSELACRQGQSLVDRKLQLELQIIFGTGRTLFTRIGLPKSLIWFMMRQAYSASSSVANSQKPKP